MRSIMAFATIFAFSLLLTGQVSVESVVIAVLLTVVTMTWRRLLRSASRRRIANPDGGQLSAWLRAIAALPADTGRVGLALARSLGGGPSPWRAVDAPFRFGTSDDPRDAGRRAVAVVAGSLTPDRIVVDVEPGCATAATHRLAGGSDGDREWLV